MIAYGLLQTLNVRGHVRRQSHRRNCAHTSKPRTMRPALTAFHLS